MSSPSPSPSPSPGPYMGHKRSTARDSEFIEWLRNATFDLREVPDSVFEDALTTVGGMDRSSKLTLNVCRHDHEMMAKLGAVGFIVIQHFDASAEAREQVSLLLELAKAARKRRTPNEAQGKWLADCGRHEGWFVGIVDRIRRV